MSDTPTTGTKLATAAPPSATLLRDRSFHGMTATQFLGAFNDNLFKQVLMLLFVAVPTVDGGTRDLQPIATFVFALPFILFSGYAGYLSDRFSKRYVIIASKVAEIVVMLLGVVLFAIYARTGMTNTLVALFAAVLFLMGTQSAFFGPGKYGILPELFRERDLPSANGIVLMTTFLAIILGSALAGVFKGSFPQQLWICGLACVLIAVVGTMTALWIRRTAIAHRGLKFSWETVLIPRDVLKLLRESRGLLLAVVVSSVFWMTAALAQMGVNAFGKQQRAWGDLKTSLLVTMISVGIAVGSIVAGALSKDRFNTRVMKCGLWGLIVGMLSFGSVGGHLGFAVCMLSMVGLGFFTGLFAVPLQVYIQSRPPEKLKGRMIATQNLMNWIGILLSAGVYFAVESVGTTLRGASAEGPFPYTWIFVVGGVFMLAVAVVYHPRDVHLSDC